jgi:hypothetical protein
MASRGKIPKGRRHVSFSIEGMAAVSSASAASGCAALLVGSTITVMSRSNQARGVLVDGVSFVEAADLETSSPPENSSFRSSSNQTDTASWTKACISDVVAWTSAGVTSTDEHS